MYLVLDLNTNKIKCYISLTLQQYITLAKRLLISLNKLSKLLDNSLLNEKYFEKLHDQILFFQFSSLYEQVLLSFRQDQCLFQSNF